MIDEMMKKLWAKRLFRKVCWLSLGLTLVIIGIYSVVTGQMDGGVNGGTLEGIPARLLGLVITASGGMCLWWGVIHDEMGTGSLPKDNSDNDQT